MNTAKPIHTESQDAETSRYANLLALGTYLGLATLVLSFAAYVLGILAPLVPLERLPTLWNLPAVVYQQRTGTPTGWGWLALIHKGDLSNLVGIALLSGCSLMPLLGLIPLYLKRRDYVYALISALVATVLVLAASGLLTGGH